MGLFGAYLIANLVSTIADIFLKFCAFWPEWSPAPLPRLPLAVDTVTQPVVCTDSY